MDVRQNPLQGTCRLAALVAASGTISRRFTPLKLGWPNNLRATLYLWVDDPAPSAGLVLFYAAGNVAMFHFPGAGGVFARRSISLSATECFLSTTTSRAFSMNSNNPTAM